MITPDSRILGIAVLPALLLACTAFGADIRTYHIGNSRTWDFDPSAGFQEMIKEMGDTPHTGWHIMGGQSMKNIFDNLAGVNMKDDAYGTWDEALKKFAWDVVTIQTFGRDQQDGTHKQEETAVAKMINYAIDHQVGSKRPNFLSIRPGSPSRIPAIRSITARIG